MDPHDVFPAAKEIPVCGGAHTVTVAPWTMAQRRVLKPKLVELFKKIGHLQVDKNTDFMQLLFVEAEEELEQIAKLVAKLPDGLRWDDLFWEDLAVIVQAIWETSFQRPDGGGIVGKALGALLASAANNASSQTKTSTVPKPPDSPSSLDGGAPPQSS